MAAGVVRAFANELAALEERVHLHPEDIYGLLDLDRLGDIGPNTLIYCCGPESLLVAVQQRSHEWREGTLRTAQHAVAVARTSVDHGGLARPADTHTTGVSSLDSGPLQHLKDRNIAVRHDRAPRPCRHYGENPFFPSRRRGRCEPFREARERNESMVICVGRAHSDRLVLGIDG